MPPTPFTVSPFWLMSHESVYVPGSTAIVSLSFATAIAAHGVADVLPAPAVRMAALAVAVAVSERRRAGIPSVRMANSTARRIPSRKRRGSRRSSQARRRTNLAQ